MTLQLPPPLMNRVHNMDAFDLLRLLPAGSVQTIVTSPPYNLRNSTGNGLRYENTKSLWSNQPMRHGYDEDYTDDLPHDEYIAWQRRCLVEMMRVIRPAGAIFYNHKWRVQAGQLQRLADDITEGFPVRQIIIWDRCGGFNFNDSFFVPSFEVIYLIARDEFRLQPGTTGLKDVWTIPPSQNKEHPNAFPESLVERCLLASTATGDAVLDPFGGIGTTAVVAKRMGRQYITGDRSTRYVEIARRRVAAQPYTPPLFDTTEADTAAQPVATQTAMW